MRKIKEKTCDISVVLGRLFLFVFLLGSGQISAGPTKVVNGDEGQDLEGAQAIQSGPIFESRQLAVNKLRGLNVSGIPGLGMLIPEVESSSLYLGRQDLRAILPEDQGTFHQSLTGRVYARTLAQPHSATRFFPIANKLELDQLVALHIHEGLHRALPISVRSDEGIVSKLTLSMTAPEATHDGVRDTVIAVIPMQDLRLLSQDSLGRPPEEEHFKKPSSLGYRLREFQAPNRPTQYRIDRMHSIHSVLYPFGGVNTPFGMGIEASAITGPKGSNLGPLGLSANLRVWSFRGFDVGLWGDVALNTLSAEELKNSPYGRDVLTLGISARKDLSLFYIENYLSVSFGGSTREKIGLIEYKHEYGEVINTKIRAGFKFWKLDLGGVGEIHLADYMKVSGGSFTFNSGRYRIVSVGPECMFVSEDWSLSLFGRWIAGTTKDANFDFLGNLMGPGVSQGGVGVSVAIFF